MSIDVQGTERLPRPDLERVQLDALREQLTRVEARSALYADRFRSAGFDPAAFASFDTLHVLDLTDKRDHVAHLAAAPPWGDHLAVALDEVRRVHFSSGTTAKPTPVCWTAPDLDAWTAMYAAGASGFGVTERDVYQCLFSFPWFVGGLGTHVGFEHLGVTSIPGGSAEARRQIETILHYGSTFLGGTPSFLLHLSEVAAESGVDLQESPVERILLGGEVGGGVAATRAIIEDRWGAKCFDGYGSLEFQPMAWECEEQTGAHLFESSLYAEVLDPATHDPVPDGSPGMLVVTHLSKEAHPLVRWNTGDIVVRDSSPCPCGRTTARLVGGVRGRADNMLVVRGVNVYPSAVEEVVRGVPGTTGEYQVLATDPYRDETTGQLQRIGLTVEATSDADHGELAEGIEAAVHEQLRVRAEVTIVEPGVLPRTTHKAERLRR